MLNIFMWILISLGAGAIGSFFTAPAIQSWYIYLQKPFFNPPNWLFAPVWTILYVMMGLAMGIIASGVTTKAANNKRAAVGLFITQLALNTLWSVVFFGFKSPLLALIVIIALLPAIYLTYKEFAKFSIIASKLLIPYLFWVSFATILNLAIVILN